MRWRSAVRVLLWLVALPLCLVVGAFTGGSVGSSLGQRYFSLSLGSTDLVIAADAIIGGAAAVVIWAGLAIVAATFRRSRCAACGGRLERVESAKYEPAPVAQPSVALILSPDGRLVWNGSEWLPVTSPLHVERRSPEATRAARAPTRSRAGPAAALGLIVGFAVAGGLLWMYLNPSPLNPPTTWAVPSSAEVNGWVSDVRLLQAQKQTPHAILFFLPPSVTALGGGGGFFIDSQHLVTADHVAQYPGSNVVVVQTKDGGTHPATILRVDASEDVAVLQVDRVIASSDVLPIGNARPARGQDLWAICSAAANGGTAPFAEEMSVTSPSESVTLLDPATKATQTIPDALVLAPVAVDASAIAEGCSGGPVLDGAGDVVGLIDGGVPGGATAVAISSIYLHP